MSFRFFPACLALILTCSATVGSAQMEAVPMVTEAWINAGTAQRSMIQSIGVRFNRNVANSVTNESLQVRHIATGALVDLSTATLVYDPRNNSANWMIDRDLGALLADGNYLAWIEIDTLLDPLQRDLMAVAEEPLDDFTFAFHQFVGDTDGDRDVDFRDASVLRETWQRNVNDDFYRSFLDLDLSNRVDESDRAEIETTYFTVLPPDPAIHLFLRNDTGEDPSDGLTSVYAVAFASIDTAEAESWQARLGEGAPFDITAQVANGSGALAPATVDQLNGSPLTPGNYQLSVEALDAEGNVLAADTLPFEFLGETRFSPRFVSEPSPGVALGQVEDAAPLNLATWTVERWPGNQGPASWVIAPDGLSVEQTINAAPSALISDQSFLNLRVTGTFQVDTGSDDDLMGFIFGYQNRGQFYVFDWKQSTQGSLGGTALEGMSIKRFDTPDDDLDGADFWWSNENRPNMAILAEPTGIGWKDFQEYEITLEFTPGRIVVEVAEEGTLLRRLEVADDQQLFRVRFFIDGLEVPLDGPNGGSAGGTYTTSFSEPGLVEVEAIAIDSAQQVTSQTSYVRVRDPDASSGEGPPATTVPPGGQVSGSPTDLRPLVSFDAPLTTDDDPTILVGTVDANGGTLGRWLLEWAPLARVDTTNLASPAVLWQVIAEGTDPLTATRIATIVPSDFPDEEIVFRLRAQNGNGLGSIASLIYNPRSLAPSTSTTELGNGPGIRPSAAFTSPTGPSDDLTQLRGTVDANGGSLRNWTVEYAPRRLVDLTDLNKGGVPWSFLQRDTNELTDGLLVTLVPDNLPDEPLVFRLTARNEGGLGSVTGIVFNPSSTTFSGPADTSGINPGTSNRPVTRITSPRDSSDDRTNLIGSVLPNGGTLDRWVVDYALLSEVNPNDLSDASVSWTVLGTGDTEIDNDVIVSLDDPAFQTGRWVLRLRAFNANGLGSLASTTLDTGDTSSPTVELTSPQSESDISFLTEVRGSIDSGGGVLASWSLEYAPTDQVGLNNLNANADWVEVASGTNAGSDLLLGTFDPTNLRNGSYVLRLRAFNTSGRGSADGLILYVCGLTKLGNFQIQFEDLNVPVSDIPIRVVRTYDSLDTSRSTDFGPGWSLSLAEADISETVPDTGDSFLFATPFKIGTRVFLTNPRGERVGFTFNVRNPRNRFLYVDFEPYFIPDPGVEETLTIAPSDFQRVEVDAAGAVYTPLYPIGYNPDHYRLTTTDGTVYEYDQREGLERILDRNGNQITFSRNGITHSDGTGVTFTRDPSGRITTITDPTGAQIHYQYDSQGRLRFVTDRTGGTTEFVYGSLRRPNFITEIIDPRGIPAVRSEYDENGRLTRQIDPRGGVTEHNYDPAGMTQVTTDRLGNVTTHEFNELGVVTRTIDREGGETRFEYVPGTTRERFITDAVGNVTSKAYDDSGKLTTLTLGADTSEDPAAPATGSTTTFTYGPSSELTAITDGNGNVSEADYDPANGELIRFTTAANDNGGDATAFRYQQGGDESLARVTAFTYDAAGNLIETRHPDGTRTTATFDAENRKVSETDEADRVTRYQYDAEGRLRFTIHPDETPDDETDNPRVELRYDAAGRQTEMIDERGHRSEYRYNSLGLESERIVHLGDEETLVTRFEYDTDGTLTGIIDPKGLRTEIVPDTRSRPVEVIHPATALHGVTRTRTAYDDLGRKHREIDEAGRGKQFTYDGLGRLVRVDHFDASGVLLPDGAVTYTYDEQDNRTSQTDAEGHTTRFEYDAMGRPTATILPNGDRETMAYDAFDNLVARTDFGGFTTTYRYDARDRVIAIIADTSHPSLALPHAPARIDLTYFPDGQIDTRTLVNATGTVLHTESFTYDARGRRIEKRTSTGNLTYTYFADDQVRTIQSDAPDGLHLECSYDAAGRLVTLNDRQSASGGATYDYDANGNLTETRYGNGILQRYSYDTRNRLLDVRAEAPDGNLYERFSYTLNPRGDRTRLEQADGRVHAYGYDELYRLTSETISAGVGDLGYVLDRNGNRISRSSSIAGLAPQTLAYDSTDRLIGDTYDTNGNTVASPLLPASLQGSDTYDFRDRLIRRTRPDGTTIDFLYDADGIRIRKVVDDGSSEVVRRFLIDDLNPGGYPEVVEERDGTDNLLVTHVHGHHLISSRQTGAGTEQLFLYDGSGSVVGVTDSSGSLLQSYRYDAYGNLLDSPDDLLTHYLYRGEQYDPDLGLYYLRARYANPGTGRFWTRDRFPGFLEDPLSLHRYLYASANPVTYADPSGFFSIAGINVSISIQFNLRNVQAIHIGKATKVLAKRFLKTAAILARHYLDYRGFTRFNLPGGLTFFAPLGIDYHLTGAGRLGADILFSQSLAMVSASFAARLASTVAGLFNVVGGTVTVGRFTMKLKTAIKLVKAVGSQLGAALSAVANSFAVLRLIRNLRNIYQVFQNMRSVAETAAEFAPSPKWPSITGNSIAKLWSADRDSLRQDKGPQHRGPLGFRKHLGQEVGPHRLAHPHLRDLTPK